MTFKFYNYESHQDGKNNHEKILKDLVDKIEKESRNSSFRVATQEATVKVNCLYRFHGSSFLCLFLTD